MHCTKLRSGPVAFHTIKTFYHLDQQNGETVPICRENNALSHPDGLPLIKQYVISISYIGN